MSKNNYDIYLNINNQEEANFIIKGLMLVSMEMCYGENETKHNLFIEELNTLFDIGRYNINDILDFTRILCNFLKPPFKNSLKIEFSKLLLIFYGVETLLYKIELCKTLSLSNSEKTQLNIFKIKNIKFYLLNIIDEYVTKSDKYNPQIIIFIPPPRL